jgi:hypothetical protein
VHYLVSEYSEVSSRPPQRHDAVLELNLTLEDVVLNSHDALCYTQCTRIIRCSHSLSLAAYIITDAIKYLQSFFLNVVVVAALIIVISLYLVECSLLSWRLCRPVHSSLKILSIDSGRAKHSLVCRH